MVFPRKDLVLSIEMRRFYTEEAGPGVLEVDLCPLVVFFHGGIFSQVVCSAKALFSLSLLC